MRRSRLSTLVRISALVVALGILQGCTLGKFGVGTYCKHRAQDFADILEIGVTVTDTPQFALFGSGVSIITLGYADLDGHFLGLGGGQLGWVRHSEKGFGLLVWGQEETGWGNEGDGEGDVYTDLHGQGFLGATVGPHGILGHVGIGSPGAGPNYWPSCMHYIHLAYGGLVLNLRYMEILDFVTSIVFIDLAGDDGYQVGTWFRLGEGKPSMEEADKPDAEETE